ncbi:MAG: hypothetical protein V3V20_00185 [Algisphaera sp.]
MEAVTQEQIDHWQAAAENAGVFKTVKSIDGILRCDAAAVEEEAWYQVGPAETHAGVACVWVGLYIADRWLSESVEADVLHQGDDFEDLLEEELIDLGYDTRLKVEHFRNDDKVFVFRSPVPANETDAVQQTLLAYEACFRELGDMTPGEDD